MLPVDEGPCKRRDPATAHDNPPLRLRRVPMKSFAESSETMHEHFINTINAWPVR